MYIFDAIRNLHADWYTQHPIAALSDAERAALAAQLGLSADDLVRQMTTPQFEMTCPLCGRPQTHLSDCKGCGTGAFTNWDFEAAYGPDARTQLHAGLTEVLTPHAGELTAYAVRNAYTCLVCADCWRETIRSSDAYRFCPLRLLADRVLQGSIVAGLLSLGLERGGHAAVRQALKNGIAAYLTDPQTVAWRQPIYTAALNTPDALARPTALAAPPDPV